MTINFEEIVRKALNESAPRKGTSPMANSNAHKTMANALLNRVKELNKSDKEEERRIIDDALKDSSVSLSSADPAKRVLMGLNGNITDEIEQYVKDSILTLRQYINPESGTYNNAFKELSKDKQAEIRKMKDFIDLQGLTYFYDSTYKRRYDSDLVRRYGIDFEKGKSDYTDSDISKYDSRDVWVKGEDDKYELEGDTRADGQNTDRYKLLERYLMVKYGETLTIPNFSLGNDKLTDTLIVNFSSAMGCPAWNRCILKHACYARSSERGKKGYGIYAANEKKNFLWMVSEHDEQLKELMFGFLKATTVNYEEVYKKFKKEIKQIYNIKNDKNLTNFIKAPFSDWDDEWIKYIKENGLIYVKYIRFNENGDFLNQAILEMADELAADFEKIGVFASAYTCRLLNYENIKHIILNGSQEGLDSSDSTGSRFARIFYAFPEEIYNCLPNTWIYNNGSEIGFAPITSNGGKCAVYKCPCKQSVGNIAKAMCGNCHFCYLPKQEGFDKIYVIVSAHGTHKRNLDPRILTLALTQFGKFDKPEIKDEFIHNLNEFIRTKTTKTGKVNDNIARTAQDLLTNQPSLKEGISVEENIYDLLDENTQCAIDIVYGHALYSMNAIVNDMVSLNEDKEKYKNNFNTLLEKISRK